MELNSQNMDTPTHPGWDTSGCCHCLQVECHCHHSLTLQESPALPKCFSLMSQHTCKGEFLLGIPAWTLLSQGRWQQPPPAHAEPLLRGCHGRTATSRGLFPPQIPGKCPFSRETKQTLAAGVGSSPVPGVAGSGSQQSQEKEPGWGAGPWHGNGAGQSQDQGQAGSVLAGMQCWLQTRAMEEGREP